MKIVFFIIACFFLLNSGLCQDTIHVWPGLVPGEKEPPHPAVVSDNHSGNVTRLTDVTDPVLEVFKPDSGMEKNISIIVCPGGAYKILAIDKEGYEIARWLNTLGITAYTLQYRVPDKQDGALQDIQRAIRLVRQTDPLKTIGVMGFSAGGSLSARAATLFDKKTYKPVDNADTLSCRPDFAVLIYPAYLDLGENHSLTPELVIGADTPPFFIFNTADDSYGNSSLVMTTALRDHKIPVELHVMPKGGHGYGLRKGKLAAETWPGLLKKWIDNEVK